MVRRGELASIAPSVAIMIFPTPAIYFARRSPPVFIQHCALLRIGSKFLLQSLEVSVRAEVDVRGTLLVDRNVPVGFQKIRCQVHLEPGANVPPEKMKMLQAAVEHSCVVLQTLRNGVAVETQFDEIQSLSEACI